MVRKVHGTNRPWYKKSTNGTKRLYEKSGSRCNLQPYSVKWKRFYFTYYLFIFYSSIMAFRSICGFSVRFHAHAYCKRTYSSSLTTSTGNSHILMPIFAVCLKGDIHRDTGSDLSIGNFDPLVPVQSVRRSVSLSGHLGPKSTEHFGSHYICLLKTDIFCIVVNHLSYVFIAEKRTR